MRGYKYILENIQKAEVIKSLLVISYPNHSSYDENLYE